ncbi:MAG TPA: threonine ammonia-lyase [Firmicutes bacterium]|nr:threonine ammonia-lyase [Bacillota bacterium]
MWPNWKRPLPGPVFKFGKIRFNRIFSCKGQVRTVQVSLASIREAAACIKDDIHHTPLSYSRTFSELSGNMVYLKAENLQKTGSFKIRGALNKIKNLTEAEKEKGVIAISAGNHAQGVALAATTAGISSTIVMPENAPIAKVVATRGYGARVELFGNCFDDCASKARELQAETGATFIHPFDDPYVIAGQGTIGLEIMADLAEVEVVLVPVGGGGLIAGTAIALKEMNPAIEVIGVEAEGAASMKASLQQGKITTLASVKTLADGIAVKTPGRLTFEIAQKYVDAVVTVNEEEIANGILMLLERGKLIVEGAGATPIAALLNNKLPLKGKRVVALLSGGNIDVNILAQIIERGLVKAGRRIKIITYLEDKPGQLYQLLGLLAQLGANIINIYHHREKMGIELGIAEVELDLETRDAEHSRLIINFLTEKGYRTRYLE